MWIEVLRKNKVVRLSAKIVFYATIILFAFSDIIAMSALFFDAFGGVCGLIDMIKALPTIPYSLYSGFFSARFVGFSIVSGFGILVAALFINLFSLSFLGIYGTFVVGFSALSLLVFMLMLNFYNIFILGLTSSVVLFKWFALSAKLTILFSFYIDPVSYSFAFLTALIGLFVYAYAFAYFRGEPNIERLLVFLNAFIASMILLVLAGNLVVLFLGWELIGITSFLLINFWSTKVSTLKAAFKAFSFNKVSDFYIFLLLVIGAAMFHSFEIPAIVTSSIHLQTIRYSNIIDASLINLFVFFLLGAAFIKSAQIGPHIWLPDSMEAPVPASALIHSATLVSAGIFLILRFYPICQASAVFHYVAPVVGLATAFYGGMVAYFQMDVKRLLAYSTISHCGFLVALTAVGSQDFVLLYLYIHGFFKALAFMCVGNIIRVSRNYQDLRRMGGYWKYMPFECGALSFILGNLSGVPFFFGYYAKHLVLTGTGTLGVFATAFAFTAALSGFLYSFKLIYYIFFDSKKARKSIYFELSRRRLNRLQYTNSTVAACAAILVLTTCAYLVLVYFYAQKVTNTLPAIDAGTSLVKNTAAGLAHTNNAKNFNYAFVNWLIIALIVLCVYARWDHAHNSLLYITRLGLLTLICGSFGTLFMFFI